MALRTKNRIAHNAALCREHLRKGHPDQFALVNEFIAETEARERAETERVAGIAAVLY